MGTRHSHQDGQDTDGCSKRRRDVGIRNPCTAPGRRETEKWLRTVWQDLPPLNRESPQDPTGQPQVDNRRLAQALSSTVITDRAETAQMSTDG